MQKLLGGNPLRFIILRFILRKIFRGTPLAIYDFGKVYSQKPIIGHPLRSIILQNLGGTPLTIYTLGIRVFAKP